MLGLGAVLVASPGLDQEGAGFGLGDFAGVVEVVEVIDGLVVLFLGILEVDDGLGEVGAGGVGQVGEGFLGADELELGGGVLGIGGIAEADELLPLLDGLTFVDGDVADATAGGEGDLGEAHGFEPSFGDDRAVGDHRRVASGVAVASIARRCASGE